MRALLLYNPTATRTRPRVAAAVAEQLRGELKLDVEATKRRDHASYLAAGAAHEGYEVVVALGGDGTLNEVLQGLVGTDVRLAVLPGGSTNVFVRQLGLPREIEACTEAVRQKLIAREDRRINVGLANDRYFGFGAGFGYDAEVVRMVEQRVRLKKTVRQATFLWCGLLAWARSRATERQLRLELPGEAAVEGLRSAVVCNADPYTFLGPLPARICPDASFDLDLDVLAMREVHPVSLLRLMRRALLRGDPTRLGFIQTWHDHERYVLRSDAPLPVHVDGDYVGESQELVLRSIPRALSVVA